MAIAAKNKLKQLMALLEADKDGACEMGLVIAPSNSAEKIIKELGEIFKDCENADLNSASGDNAADLFIRAFKEKKNLILSFSGEKISSPTYNLLRRLSAVNMAQIFRGKEEINARWPKETKIVFITDWETIKVNGNAQFLKLFGPALDLTVE